MALKAEEKLKWSSYRRFESSMNVKDKDKKIALSTSEHPNPRQGEGNKDRRKGVTGYRSYECPNKKAELHLVEEGQGEEELEPTYAGNQKGTLKRSFVIPTVMLRVL